MNLGTLTYIYKILIIGFFRFSNLRTVRSDFIANEIDFDLSIFFHFSRGYIFLYFFLLFLIRQSCIANSYISYCRLIPRKFGMLHFLMKIPSSNTKLEFAGVTSSFSRSGKTGTGIVKYTARIMDSYPGKNVPRNRHRIRGAKAGWYL